MIIISTGLDAFIGLPDNVFDQAGEHDAATVWWHRNVWSIARYSLTAGLDRSLNFFFFQFGFKAKFGHSFMLQFPLICATPNDVPYLLNCLI